MSFFQAIIQVDVPTIKHNRYSSITDTHNYTKLYDFY